MVVKLSGRQKEGRRWPTMGVREEIQVRLTRRSGHDGIVVA